MFVAYIGRFQLSIFFILGDGRAVKGGPEIARREICLKKIFDIRVALRCRHQHDPAPGQSSGIYATEIFGRAKSATPSQKPGLGWRQATRRHFGLQVHEGEPGLILGPNDSEHARHFEKRVLRMAWRDRRPPARLLATIDLADRAKTIHQAARAASDQMEPL